MRFFCNYGAIEHHLDPQGVHVLPNTLTFFNSKGGSGKTTMNCSHAVASAAAGWNTLLVDLDAQGSAGRQMGVKKTPDDDEGQSLRDAIAMHGRAAPNIVRDVRPGLDMIVGGKHTVEIPELLLSAERTLGRDGAHGLIETVLAPYAGDYDLIVFDLPPAPGGVLHDSIFATLHYVVYTVAPNQMSIDSLEQAWTMVVQGPNPDLEVLGLCVPMWQANAKKKNAGLKSFLDNLSGQMGGYFSLIDPVVSRSDTAGADMVSEQKLAIELVPLIPQRKKEYFNWIKETKAEAKKQGRDVSEVRKERKASEPARLSESLITIAEEHKRITIEVNSRFRAAQGEYLASLMESA